MRSCSRPAGAASDLRRCTGRAGDANECGGYRWNGSLGSAHSVQRALHVPIGARVRPSVRTRLLLPLSSRQAVPAPGVARRQWTRRSSLHLPAWHAPRVSAEEAAQRHACRERCKRVLQHACTCELAVAAGAGGCQKTRLIGLLVGDECRRLPRRHLLVRNTDVIGCRV